MKEYIEREAAIELGKKQSCAGIIDGGNFCNISANMLRKIPTADVVEVKHGRWIERPYLMLSATKFCSLCDSDYKMPYKNYNYCPNCGAKMDGGTNN
jgi:hypothetical protein